MNNFVEQLRLAEKAAEDIYFAKVNRELIELLHMQMQMQMQAQTSVCQPSRQSGAKVRTERFKGTPES